MSSAVAISVVLCVVILYLLIFGVAIANYVLSSLGMYRFAKGRQISDPWMAWIPVVNDYLLGKVTEQYDGSRGINRKWSKVMLALSLINIGGIVVFFVVYFVMIFATVFQTIAMEGMDITNTEIAGSFIFLFVVIFVAALIMSFASIAYAVCKYVCIYKVFELAVPEKSLKYFLLSMLVPLAYGICLMKIAKIESLKAVMPAIEDEENE